MLGQNIGRVGLPDMSSGGRPSLTLDFVGIPVLNERITFSRTSGATWFSPDGVLEGVDFSTSSVAIGTGSKTFTLTADAGANRYWAVGDLVRVSQQSNSANFMEGTVTSYTVSTQVLVIDVTSTGGSGTIASWRVSSHMPRFDYNPSTLAAQGLLIEEARTNSIRNNTMQGAVVGTPGTLPTTGGNAWFVSAASGLATNVIGTGVSAGITYIDIQLVGTATGTSYVLEFEPATGVAGSAGQTWTNSFWLSQVGGTTTNITGTLVRIQYRDSAGVLLATGSLATSALSGTLIRSQFTSTAPASTAFVRPGIQVTTSAGAVDITIRIGLPQLELGAFATSVIPTITTALTRSADVASVNTLSPWYNASAGTIYAEATPNTPTTNTANQIVLSIDDTTINNRIQLTRGGNGGAYSTLFASSGVTGYNPSLGTWANQTSGKLASAFTASDQKFAYVGSLDPGAGTGTVPSVTRMLLGARADNTLQFNGYLRRIVYYPRRLSNAELQAITA